jgi:MFS family permease
MDHTMLGVGSVSLETSLKKATRRILPFLFICYFFAYLDRVNVGFAKLQMQTELSFSDVVYGLGAGVFFIGYFLFEIPGNLILHRVGARRWIARVMITFADARWLDEEEKHLLEDALRQGRPRLETSKFGSALKSSQVWALALIYFCIQRGVYAISFRLPTRNW